MRADSEDNVSRTGTGGSKGESMTTAAEAGAEDTGSDGVLFEVEDHVTGDGDASMGFRNEESASP